ncbi:aspartic peptidase domain-containing protein [Poronia punctata]|nr:aspartic peptidase domain-containing protein [Poronia punctata]
MRARMKTAYLSSSAALNAISKAQVVQLQWTSDLGNLDGQHTLGPDGPWQAVTIGVGITAIAEIGHGRFSTDVWPTGGSETYIVANTSNGLNALDDSPSATNTQIYAQAPREWFVYNTTTTGQSWDAYGYFESIVLAPLTSNDITVNRSILVMNNSIFTEADGRVLPNKVGILGLGPESVNSPDNDPSILDQLKAYKNITSSSFGMHMGSAPHNQSGSLVLGGYEQNRALGKAGTFKIDDSAVVNMFLLDVLLGTQVGNSPYNQSTIGSIYQGVGNNSYAADIVKLQGGTPGSVLVEPSPSVPYIYLPPGTCETASQYLPVIWNESLALYLWNQSDPKYSTIINSPAYMAIVLADSDARNVTIKVPFQLLNLTLSRPLVDKPRSYFPCKSLTTENTEQPVVSWPLGRAFLQAAFYGVNYDTQTVFMAQGPGPNMEQRVVKTIDEKDTSILTNPIDSFEKSWSTYWTVLSEPGPTTLPAHHHQSGISAGAKAGIAVGSILGGLGIFGAAILLWRRTSNKEQTEDLGPTQDRPVTPVEELEASRIAVDKSDPLPHEMMAPNVVHEAPHELPHYELPANHFLYHLK